MKANELMTGDYFRIAQTGKIIKIVAVDEYNGSVDYFDGDAGGVLTIGVEKIEPIPLTADILQKIGLRQLVINGKDGEQEYYVLPVVGYYNLTPEQRLHQSSCVYSPSKDHTCGWLFIYADEGRIEVICDYVHQVQRQFKYIGWDSDFKLK